MSTALEPNLYKVCLSGKSGVGKTSIFNAVRGKEFSKCPKPGTDCYKLNVEVSREGQNPIDVTLQIWDTAGLERERSLTDSYYRGSKAVITVFSIESRDSFNEVYREIERIKDKDFAPDALFFLVGNKIDLKKEEVSQAQVLDCQRSNPNIFSEYVRTSAKTNVNITELFNKVAFSLVSKRVSPVEQENTFRPLYDPQTKKSSCKCWK